uniref:Uncharacterized protein n=1 Tax=Amazona collaria TaxID=241587 RepID=A0A8B9G2C8_9PSIT
MAAGAVELRRLQWRLEEVEQRIGVGDGAPGTRKVADELVKVQAALNNIASKRERIKILFKKSEWGWTGVWGAVGEAQRSSKPVCGVSLL